MFQVRYGPRKYFFSFIRTISLLSEEENENVKRRTKLLKRLAFSAAYGIAYSRAPVNMRGLVSAIYLFTTGFANIVNLATSAVIVDPYLVWDFLVPAVIGAVVTVSFVSPSSSLLLAPDPMPPCLHFEYFL